MKQYKKLVVGLLMVPVIANAEYMSGNMLLQRMNSTEITDRLLAIGYVMGVSDVGQNKYHCSPQDVTSGQSRDIVKQYIERNPSTRNQSADLLTMVALMQAFPCPKTESKPNGRGA